jgi:hypothetical protein
LYPQRIIFAKRLYSKLEKNVSWWGPPIPRAITSMMPWSMSPCTIISSLLLSHSLSILRGDAATLQTYQVLSTQGDVLSHAQGLVDCLETGRIVVDIRCRYWILKGQFGEIENDSMHPKPNTHHLTCGLVPPRIYHANESSLLLLPLSSSLKQGNSFIYNKGMESKW